MRLIDDRGRLFGRLNIVDAAVLAVVALLIPMAYGAYLLFRPPPARIVAIEPARVQEGMPHEVRLRGEHLRPYLRVVVGTESAAFLFGDTEGGVLRLPALKAGTYDLALMNEAAELSRAPGALVVEATPVVTPPPPPPPPPPAALVTVGWFSLPTAARADALARVLTRRDASFDWGRVIGVQPVRRDRLYPTSPGYPTLDHRYGLIAVVEFRCVPTPNDCRINDLPLNAGSVIPLAIGGEATEFRIDELHPLYSTRVEVLMRCSLTPDEVAHLQRWRADQRVDLPALNALRPALVSFDEIGRGSEPDLRITMVRVRLPVVQTARGWIHAGRIIRIGDQFVAEGPSQQLPCRVVAIDDPEVKR